VSLGGDRREGGWAVADKIRELPVDDFFAKGRVREDGRMMHDMYLVEVKTPSEIQGQMGLLQAST
jgi:branched-chain amino acid transport system substrate-binding protein